MKLLALSKPITNFPTPDYFPTSYYYNYYPFFFSLFVIVIIISLFVAIILSIWVYMDARKRTEHALLYAFLTFLFWPLGIAVYLLSRKSFGQKSATALASTSALDVKIVYFLIASFVFLSISFFALIDLVNNLAKYLNLYYAFETFYAAREVLGRISYDLSIFLVIFPVYFFHWREGLKRSIRKEMYSCLRKYIYVVLFFYFAVFIISSIRFISHFNNMLFGIEDLKVETFLPSLFTTLASAGVLLYHRKFKLRLKNS